MTMRPRLRQLALTAHVVSSVGWLGAVGAFLALAIAGLSSEDPQVVRGAYLALEPTGWFVIVRLSLAALVSGLVQSLGTAWGLWRHYWVVVKLVLTVLATVLLVLHMQAVGVAADRAGEGMLAGGELRRLRIQLVIDAGAAMVVLLVAAVLSIFKPRGMTRYGRRKQREALAP
jgi:hypothetical protein